MIIRAWHSLVHHLTPTQGNGFVPHLLKELPIAILMGIGVALFTFSQIVRSTDYFHLLTAEVYPAVIVSLTNDDRQANSLSQLSRSAALDAIAKLKAEDMAAKGYFAHTSPEGRTPWYWFAQEGYQFIYAGENLAINYDDSQDVQNAWLNSPTHRQNIMNTNFTEMGVATATGLYNGKETTFVVEVFGMPATAKATIVREALPVAEAAEVPTAKTPPKVSTSVMQQTAATAPEAVKHTEEKVAEHLSVLEETDEFVSAKNTDPALEAGEGTETSMTTIPFTTRALLQSDKIAGFGIQIIFIILIIATAGLVAREWEKHHTAHMLYGTCAVIVMGIFLFVGKLGVFDTTPSLAELPQTYTSLR